MKADTKRLLTILKSQLWRPVELRWLWQNSESADVKGVIEYRWFELGLPKEELVGVEPPRKIHGHGQ